VCFVEYLLVFPGFGVFIDTYSHASSQFEEPLNQSDRSAAAQTRPANERGYVNAIMDSSPSSPLGS
jgi:hypothetical protein